MKWILKETILMVVLAYSQIQKTSVFWFYSFVGKSNKMLSNF